MQRYWRRGDSYRTHNNGLDEAYSIRTGSYPQVMHNQTLTNVYGTMNCTEFVDANGKRYNDWIPAIRLE